MSIKFKKSRVEKIVREELELLIREFFEADDKEDKEPGVQGADKDNDNVAPEKSGTDMAPKRGAEIATGAPEGDEPKAPPPGEESPPEQPADPEAGDQDIPDEEVPAGDPDPSDTELSQDVEDQGDEEEKEGGAISKEITGRQIQSIAYNPESKMMGGAHEVVIQFEEIPHPLHILLGKSGMIKFFFKGQIRNEL